MTCRRITALCGVIAILSSVAPAQAGTSFGVNRMRVVAATGTAAENCQSLRDVLTSITDNDASTRYLVQLEPGTYDCGTSSVILGSGIALVGAGVDHTLIVGEVQSNLLGLLHVNGSSVQIRSLKVSNQVNGATQDRIGVSILEVGGSGSISGIELRDVEIFGNEYSIKSYNASIDVWGANLSSVVSHDGDDPNDRVATLRYSAIAEVQLPGDAPAICYFCHNPFSGNELQTNCDEPPP